MRHLLRDNSGVSTLETVFVIGIIAMISMVVVDLYLLHGRLFYGSSTQAELQVDASRINEEMGEAMRVADAIISSRTVNSVLYITDNDAVILRMPSIDSGGQVINGTYDYVVFYRDATDTDEFKMSQEADAASDRIDLEKTLSDSLISVNISYNNSNPVLADFVIFNATLRENVFQRPYDVGVHNRFYISN